MRPTTTINTIMYVTGCLALLCLSLWIGAIESRCTGLTNSFFLKDVKIVRLKEENIKLRTLDGAVRVFDLFLPESYRAELAQIEYKLRKMEESVKKEMELKEHLKEKKGKEK